jgi:hypothetical protein
VPIIRIDNETGLDWGGVRREWLTNVIKETTKIDSDLFESN